jgi:hypothetical protein
MYGGPPLHGVCGLSTLAERRGNHGLAELIAKPFAGIGTCSSAACEASLNGRTLP